METQQIVCEGDGGWGFTRSFCVWFGIWLRAKCLFYGEVEIMIIPFLSCLPG
jgi:hypothetical protein